MFALLREVLRQQDICCPIVWTAIFRMRFEAEAWMQRIIDSDSDDCGNYYDQACLYARMGKTDESVTALETVSSGAPGAWL